jgi:hypothetical protein
VPLLHRDLVLVENRLLRERRLGRNEVGALQLQQQEGVKGSRGRRASRRSMLRKKQIRCIEKTNNSQLFLSPHRRASGAAATAATSRSTSRSPAPRGTGPREMMGATVRLRSPPRGAGRPSSRRGEATASGVARHLGHDIARSPPPG